MGQTRLILEFAAASLGEVTAKAAAAGHETDYGYDTLGRMRTESFVGASGENATWTYAASGNGVGQLTAESKANGYSRNISYNGLGEPITDKEESVN